MRTSKFLLATLKETPTDAEIVSHRLMLRAGLIRQLAAGLYTWLPLGLRVLHKVEEIIREEMDRAGAQEVLMPAVQPAELWRESGRWDAYGPELLRLRDRHRREFCFGPTHEEVITELARREIKSYRQLPALFYQIQTKFRDEIRPRFGVMRAREFLMKDAYSFHADEASLDATYAEMHAAYTRIFTRLGLRFRAVEAATGTIGGQASHEFHVLADSGEDAIAECGHCGYSANVELAPVRAPQHARPAPAEALERVATPDRHSIEQVSEFFGVAAQRTVKTLLVEGVDGPVALVLRGDHTLSAHKAEQLAEVAKPLKLLDAEAVRRTVGCAVGSIGPVDLKLPVVADTAAAQAADFICGANEDGYHLRGVNWGRDLPEPERADLRAARAGDACPRCAEGALTVHRGIEVGHIFRLGTKYSRAMNATYLDARGRALVMPMGCYGIGVSRIVAAAIEQNHDERGIVWPEVIAPFTACIVPIGMRRSKQVAEATEQLYARLVQAGIDVLLDDRDERPGVMFADMDLIGIAHRFVVGERRLAQGTVEYKHRAGTSRDVPLERAVEVLRGRQ